MNDSPGSSITSDTHDLLSVEAEGISKILLEEATVATAIYLGPGHRILVANHIMLGYWGKPASVIGKNLAEAVPELEGQPFIQLLNNVYSTGNTYETKEEKAILKVNGKLQPFYFDFIYKALHDKNGKIYGIFHTATDVADKIKSKEKIGNTEIKMQLALDSAQFGMYELVLATNELIPDAGFNAIWGCNENMRREDYAALIHKDDLENRRKAHENSLTTGILIYEARLIWKDQSEHWIRVNGKILYDEKGTPEKIIGVVQDITEQVRVQKKLMESEERIRRMIVHAPVAMCLFRGPEYIVETANEKMVELWGREKENIIGKPIFAALPEVKEQGLELVLFNVFTTGETFSANERPVLLPRPTGNELVYLNFVYQAQYDDEFGNISGILAIAIDVTQEVIARKEIETAQERARLAIDAARLGIFEANLVTDNLVRNTRFDEIFHLESYHTKKDLIACIHPDDVFLRSKAYKKAFVTGYLDYEARFILANQSIIWIKAKGIVLFNDEGKGIKVYGVVRDITEQKQFSEALENKVRERTGELAEANYQLRESNTELNEFAFIASHDLQEPLRKVRTFTNLLASSLGELDGRSMLYMEKIQGSVERMQNLINDVLKFSQLVKKSETFELIDLNEAIQSLLSDFELLIEQKKATINIISLPAVFGIPVQIRQLFTNLLSNSLKFSHYQKALLLNISSRRATQEEVLEIKELNDNQAYYLVEFSDNGIGFEQQYARQIFIIFQRLHGKNQFEGTGIGLAMCKKIMSNHKGTIYATSVPGMGTTFSIFFPIMEKMGEVTLQSETELSPVLN